MPCSLSSGAKIVSLKIKQNNYMKPSSFLTLSTIIIATAGLSASSASAASLLFVEFKEDD